MTKETGEYHGEAEMAGLYAGGVLGALVFGAMSDLLNSEINSMAWYAAGSIVGAIGGLVAAAVFRRLA